MPDGNWALGPLHIKPKKISLLKKFLSTCKIIYVCIVGFQEEPGLEYYWPLSIPHNIRERKIEIYLSLVHTARLCMPVIVTILKVWRTINTWSRPVIRGVYLAKVALNILLTFADFCWSEVLVLCQHSTFCHHVYHGEGCFNIPGAFLCGLNPCQVVFYVDLQTSEASTSASKSSKRLYWLMKVSFIVLLIGHRFPDIINHGMLISPTSRRLSEPGCLFSICQEDRAKRVLIGIVHR